MKIHTKKKAYRAMLKQLAKDGYMNQPDGRMLTRSSGADNAMKRDYSPQE